MLQVISGIHVFHLLAVEHGGKRANRFLIEHQVGLGMDGNINALLENDIKRVEKIGLDLIGVGNNAPYPAKQGVGLHRVNFTGKALWRCAAPVFISSLNIIAAFLDHGVRIDDLFQDRDVRAVVGEIMLRVILRIDVE